MLERRRLAAHVNRNAFDSLGGGSTMTSINTVAPQFLVDDLSDSLKFYNERVGFRAEFVYAAFYASVSRDRATIHLMCAPKLEAERAHRKLSEHLDAFLEVLGVADLAELVDWGASIRKPMETRPWGAVDFYVEDPDGYILCFSQGA